MSEAVQRIVELYETKGAARYGGEAVTQLEHALQCATLALNARAEETLVAACLLHDLGHLVHDLGEDPAADGVDDRHEYRCVHLLRRLYGDEVAAPVRLHVEAKRYLCAVRPDYYATLSTASKTSLRLQGGPFSTAEAERFIAEPFAAQAARLRAWDDRAKVPGMRTPCVDHFADILERCLR